MEAKNDNLKELIGKANRVLLVDVEKLLPGGKISGEKYRCDNIEGGHGDNPSLSVCLETGKITDFGSNGYGVLKSGEKGYFYGDLFDVHCWIEKMPESERYKEAARLAGESEVPDPPNPFYDGKKVLFRGFYRVPEHAFALLVHNRKSRGCRMGVQSYKIIHSSVSFDVNGVIAGQLHHSNATRSTGA